MKDYIGTKNTGTIVVLGPTIRCVIQKFRRFLSALATTSMLAVAGCSTTGSGNGGDYSAETDPLYNGIPAITFDKVLIGDGETDPATLGDQALQRGEQDKAIYAYLRAAQSGGDKAVLFSKIGALHQGRGNHDLAFAAFSRAMQANPDYVPALEGIGLVHLKRQEHSDARSYLERAVELDQQRFWEEQDTTEQKSKAPGEADKPAAPTFQNANEAFKPFNLPPHDADSPHRAYNGLGILADLAGDHRQALRVFRVADAIRPRSAITQNNLGYSYYLSGNLRMAEYHFRKAMKINPDFKRSWCNLALVYNRQGHNDEALGALTRVMSEAEAYNTLGYLNMVAGKHQEADQFLQQAIALSPSYYEQAQQNLTQNRKRRSR